MTAGAINQAASALSGLADQPIGISAARTIASLRKLLEEHTVADHGRRVQILDTNAVKTPEGKWSVSKEEFPALAEKLSANASSQVEIDGKYRNSLTFEDLASAKISANDLEALAVFM